MKGMIVSVLSNRKYRNCAKGSGGGGQSATCDELTVVNLGPDCEIFEVTPDRPAFLLVPGNLRGTVKLVPADMPKGVAGPMAGGNYAETSDSRWSAAIEKILGHRFYGAVAIHDRFDTWADNEILSR